MVKLCKNCIYCVTRRVGFVSSRSFCRISKGSESKNTKLGVEPWRDEPHPRCPLTHTEERSPNYKAV